MRAGSRPFVPIRARRLSDRALRRRARELRARGWTDYAVRRALRLTRTHLGRLIGFRGRHSNPAGLANWERGRQMADLIRSANRSRRVSCDSMSHESGDLTVDARVREVNE